MSPQHMKYGNISKPAVASPDCDRLFLQVATTTMSMGISGDTIKRRMTFL